MGGQDRKSEGKAEPPSSWGDRRELEKGRASFHLLECLGIGGQCLFSSPGGGWGGVTQTVYRNS